MSLDLISEADYAQLPADPLQKFAALEGICRRNMLEAISQDTTIDFDTLLRTSYMTIVTAAAEELGVEGVNYVDRFETVQLDVQEFIRVVGGVIARIRLRSTSGRDGLSVRLANRTKGIIEHEVAKLRDAVSESNLDDDKKRRLLGKIEEFRSELHRERLRYGIAFASLTVVAAGLVGTTAFLADAPDAVATIMQLIGQDKEKEDAEVLRLEGPQGSRLLTDASNFAVKKTSRLPDSNNIPF